MPVSGSAPLSVSFKDKSSSTPHEWYWEFGDGIISTEKNPSHTYMETGQYTVRLTVGYPNNGPTRQETKYNYITVQKGSEAEASISLSPGWNFISTPKTLADNWNTAEKLFGSLPVAGHSVFSFNPTMNQWVSLTATSVFKPFEPVWIYSEHTAAIPLHFAPDAMQIPPTTKLTKGWNTIGITSVSQISAHNALLSMKDDWVYVIGYDATTQRYEQTIMNVPESHNSILVPGKGYWIYMSVEGELAGTGV
jgi:PKD repeat protein